MTKYARTFAVALAAFLALPTLAVAKSPAAPAEKAARTVYLQNALSWEPQIAYRSVTLRVVGPGGFVHDQDFGAGKPVLDLAAVPGMADGQYKFELVFGRKPDTELETAMANASIGDDGTIHDAGLRARVERLRETVSGSFRLEGGKILSPDLVEPKTAGPSKVATAVGAISPKDQVIPDDLIVQGSACIGLDCVINESFGFDTLRLKENNTRIKFDDTSASAGFPATDWQLTANDSASGGLNKFSIEDITAATIPFTVEGASPSNSLYVASTGKVGFRTNTPVLDLHARTGNTPGIRLEQDASSGFTAQTWDMAGNEANFFIRDVTGGSKLPFRIQPGAPTNSISISSSGNVGFGTNSPAKKLVVTNNGAAGFEVDPVGYPGGVRMIAFNRSAGVYNPARWEALIHEFNIDGTERARLDYTGNFGIGTSAPAKRLAVSNSGGEGFEVDPIAYVGGVRMIAFNRATAAYIPARWEASQHEFNINGVEKARFDSAGNLGIGTSSPIAKLHVEGNARINGSLQVTGACCGPDYVFQPGFKIASIEENAAYMWKHSHLPAVGPARTTEDGKGVVNVFAQSNGMLEELEKAHIYIERLNSEIKTLKVEAEARDVAFRQELAELKALIRK